MSLDAFLWAVCLVAGTASLAIWIQGGRLRLWQACTCICLLSYWLFAAAGYLHLALLPVICSVVALLLLDRRPSNQPTKQAAADQTQKANGPARESHSAAVPKNDAFIKTIWAGTLFTAVLWFVGVLPTIGEALRLRSFDSQAFSPDAAEIMADVSAHPEVLVFVVPAFVFWAFKIWTLAGQRSDGLE